MKDYIYFGLLQNPLGESKETMAPVSVLFVMIYFFLLISPSCELFTGYTVGCAAARPCARAQR